jgi:hypothetical protein
MVKDHCISCGVETPYDFETHIDIRVGYIEGLGQCCINCMEEKIDDDVICLPKELIPKTPNNYELGEKIRRLFFKASFLGGKIHHA